MRFNRLQAHLCRRPTLLGIMIGAPACLYVFGAWIDAVSIMPLFWRQAILILIATAAVSAGAWWITCRRALRLPFMRTGAPLAQRLAYLLTFLGWLLLVVLLWGEVRQVALLGVPSPTRMVLTLVAVWGLLVGVIAQVVQLPPAQAWDMHRLGAPELNLILQLAVVALLLLPATPPAGTMAWLTPVQVIGVALFAGQLALQVLRRPGVAVMIFAAVLFYRALANFVLAQQPNATAVGAAVHFLALAPAGALDMVYALRLANADALRTFHFALAAGISVALIAALIFWPQLPGAPPLTPETGVLVSGPGALIGLACGWCGAILGRTLRAAPGGPTHPA
ncbi:MAG TPA: hypothetical protein GYA08_16075 [Chloroflexi bacterium]|nr:hypothetical protein [Chloroflexota bacterium]